MSVAAALSAVRVTGMPSCKSSHAVKRAPWSHGRVSLAKTPMMCPAATPARTTPSAVPYPPVASAPALQCVSTLLLAWMRAAPNSPMRRLAAMSSAWMRCASSSRREAGSPSTVSATLRMRAMAQRRFTAVGRAAARSSQSLPSCSRQVLASER